MRLILLADATVLSMVGSRIYPSVLSQSTTFPAISFRLQNEEEIEEALTEKAGIPVAEFIFYSTARGESAPDVAAALDKAVRLALQTFHRGTVSDNGSPVQSLYIQRIRKDFSTDFYDDTTQTHQAVSRFQVWAEQQQPT